MTNPPVSPYDLAWRAGEAQTPNDKKVYDLEERTAQFGENTPKNRMQETME